MTAAALLEAASSGRSAPSAGRLKPYRNGGGQCSKPAADLPPNVCKFRLTLTFRPYFGPSQPIANPLGRVERWRGAVGRAYLLPPLSSVGAPLARP